MEELGKRLKKRGEPSHGSADAVVMAASELYCSICQTTPCFLLSTAAVAVMQEQLNADRNMIGAVRYVQSIEKLQACLTRHLEVTRDLYSLDQSLHVTDRVLEELREQGVNTDHLKTNLNREVKA